MSGLSSSTGFQSDASQAKGQLQTFNGHAVAFTSYRQCMLYLLACASRCINVQLDCTDPDRPCMVYVRMATCLRMPASAHILPSAFSSTSWLHAQVSVELMILLLSTADFT